MNCQVNQVKTNKQMSSLEVKQAIRQMQNYDVNYLNILANKAGLSLMVVDFWYQAIHS